MTKRCPCGREYVLTEKDLAYYEAKGWRPPNHCHSCRFDRRQLRGGIYHQLGGEFHADRQKQ